MTGDVSDEEGFEPCRDERCSMIEIHPKHKLEAECPLCGGALIKMPRKSAKCSGCAWRGKPLTKAAQLHA